MRRALYEPDLGFFAGPTLRSVDDGDFLTSPEVSPLFGETLARFVEAEFDRIGESSDNQVVEVGAGSGSLLEPLLRALEAATPASAVEIAPLARAAIGERLPTVRVVESLGAIGEIHGVVVANELLDNVPMALALKAGSEWRERWVGVEDGDLVWVDATCRDSVAGWLDRWAGPVPDGGIVEVQIEAGEWIGATLGQIAEGALIVIDYGETAEGLAHRRAEGTLRTYQRHHLGPHPLDAPGETDLTADVNFTAVISAMSELAMVEYFPQREFLEQFGIRDQIERLRAEELAAARAGDAMAQMRLRSDRTGAETLLHPRGLGDFRVAIGRKPVG